MEELLILPNGFVQASYRNQHAGVLEQRVIRVGGVREVGKDIPKLYQCILVLLGGAECLTKKEVALHPQTLLRLEG